MKAIGFWCMYHCENVSRPLADNISQLGTQALLQKNHSCSVTGITNLRISLEENLKRMHHQRQFLEANKVSIYRVPAKLRKVEPRAYEPHFISIGPYHRGSPNLQTSERLKWCSLNRVVGSSELIDQDELDRLIAVLDDVEHEAREHYSEDVELSKDEFIKMMLLDGCFIIELFRELNRNNFAQSSLLSKRWMLPVVRRDLITLENQLPMVVLKKLFEETSRNSTQEPSLEELALHFFDPLMPRAAEIIKQSIESATTKASETLNQSIDSKTRGRTSEILMQSTSQFTEGFHQYHFRHLLDLFHSSVSLGEVKRGKEPHMYSSVTELKEAGIKVRVLGKSQPLEFRFEKGVLRMPCLRIDDHTGSFFRNIVAYEQCHPDCKPDMTTYLFFLDKLINSAEDVGLLHYEGVIQHSLGSNKQVAKLVNNLCLEVEHDGQDSYLFEVVENINSHSDHSWTKAKARLKHDYFSNLWVSISTLAALLLLYLTLLQTSCDAIEAREKQYLEKTGWWGGINLFLVDPVAGLHKAFRSAKNCIVGDIAPKDPPTGGPQQCI